MFDPVAYHGGDATAAKARVEAARIAVEAVARSTDGPPEWTAWLCRRSAFLLSVAEIERRLADGTFQGRPGAELEAENLALSADVLPERYEGGDLDPAGMSRRFGATRGALLAWFSASLRSAITYAFDGRRAKFAECLEHFAAFAAAARGGEASDAALRDAATALARRPDPDDRAASMRMSFDPAFALYRRIAERAAATGDLRLLYRYGRRITPYERLLFRYLATLPAERIVRIADQVVRCFITGCRTRNRPLGKRDTVGLRWHAGQERLVDALATRFAADGVTVCVEEPESTAVNRQVAFDHRFDGALFLDEPLARASEAANERALDACAPLLARYAGFAYLFKFGEANFEPLRKPEASRLSPEQESLLKAHQRRMMEAKERHIPERELSFTAIAFPSPEIGPDFEAIFDRTVEVNLLDSARWEAIQQKLVDALDRCDRVEVKGRDGNRTAMTVALRGLSDPTRQTKFVNCGADINIPVGEVFTSPVLAGTNGLLHLKDTWLARVRYRDLWFEFRDGTIADYGCANFPDPAVGRRHVYEHLLMPHETLPLGEFAIGTNTPAYVMVREFGILHCLTELLIEKMGPHFAIGDTCFLLNEEVPHYNALDGKEMIARDNERSARRHEDFALAYTFKHTDITIPYEEIGSIVGVEPGGARVPLLVDGRFVLPGTESLNEAFDRAAGGAA